MSWQGPWWGRRFVPDVPQVAETPAPAPAPSPPPPKAIDTACYNQIIDVIERARELGLTAIVVFQPDIQNDMGDPEWPDLIVCTSAAPEVIAALLRYRDRDRDEVINAESEDGDA